MDDLGVPVFQETTIHIYIYYIIFYCRTLIAHLQKLRTGDNEQHH